MARIASIFCDGCGSHVSRVSPDDEVDRFESLELRAARQGWERMAVIPSQGERDYCPRCLEAIRGACERMTSTRLSPSRATIEPLRARGGFTLVELLVVLAIIAIVAVAALPTVRGMRESQPIESGAATVQAALFQARDLAVRAGTSGVRLEPDDAWPVARRADGTIDPSRPIAYARITPLESPPPYSTGLVTVHGDGWPQWFTPAPGRLVLEESTVDADGLRCEPTAWAWNIRVGDVVQYLGHAYTVTGPTAIPIGSLNSEGFVNWGPPGAVPPLDRGAGPVEWLYLSDRLDDDRDGFSDEGWDGLDNDLDGLVDEDDEWEVEQWGVGATQAPSAYQVDRRPIVAGPARSSRLPASVVIDATAWTQTGLDPATGGDSRLRSQVPLDPYTGAVDLLFEGDGRLVVPSPYGRPAARSLGVSSIHLWIADRGDVLTPTATVDAATGRTTYSLPAPSVAAIVSIDLDSGRISAAGADVLDPAGSMRATEGGGR